MTSVRRVFGLLLAGLLVLAGAGSAAADGRKGYISSELTQAHRTQRVIITVEQGREHEVLDRLKRYGGSVKSAHPSINSIAATIHSDYLNDLADHGAVSITPDSVIHAAGAPLKSTTGVSKPALDPNAPQGQAVSTLRLSLGLAAGSAGNLAPGTVNGTGVGVAIVDSGIYPGADFAGRIKGFYDFTKLNKFHQPTQPAPYDDLGHGTHIAGLIGSAGAAPGYMFQGIAPNVNLFAFKVLDKNGSSSTSTVIAALEYIVAHKKQLGVHVINLSLGHPITSPARFDPLVQAVEDATAKGLIVVIAAGNDGPGNGSVNSPANAPSAITVGAADGKTTVTRADDYVPSFSSHGPTWYDGFAKPDVIAPGVNLYSDASPGSTLVTSTNPVFPQQTVGGVNLIDLNGTSMAAAVTTGVVALQLDANTHQANDPLTANAAKAILEYTAIPVANADYFAQGAGQINAAGAVELSGAINTSAPINSWWLQTGVSGSSSIGGLSYPWSQQILWGASVLRGRLMYYNARMFSDDNIIWGTGIIRGNNLVSPSRRVRNVRARFYDFDNIIWGTDFTVVRKNIVWATDALDNIIWGTSLAPFRVVGERVGNKIVWGNDAADNIIWGTLAFDNIVWGTSDGDNIIWGTWYDLDNIIWGTTDLDNIIWGTSKAEDNIIWGTSSTARSLLKQLKPKDDGDNIIWGTGSKAKAKSDSDNIIWGTGDSDNIIWGTVADFDNIIWGTNDDNIVWGTDADGDNIIWGTDDSDNIVWGTDDLDNIVWGTAVSLLGKK